jgi:alanyl-tRNA synthetase
MLSYIQFENLLSSQRMNRYLVACHGNTQKTLSLYRLNLQLSQTLFGVISLFEVVLRNKINSQYKLGNENWLISGFLHRPSANCNKSIQKIDEAIQKLQDDNKSITNDDVLSKLSFSFWKMLFAQKQFIAGGNNLLRIFTRCPSNITYTEIYSKLDSIGLLRNRIAHHEPICFANTVISTQITEKVYKNIVKLVRWMGINPQELFEGYDDIPLYLQKINDLNNFMKANEIRKTFLDFFASKQHLIVPSAPIVPKNDSTLMFINSGMAPFKDFFLGNGNPPSKRIADTQKCLRVSGKHNDLEDVGIDTYHHTLFEMLGNWSFGDYFKQDAITWAWELLTEIYKLPKDRLYVSVFGGDKTDGLEPDNKAFAIWEKILGGKDRILYGSKKDNFWEMGETGPCGCCSEIHIDLRPDEERKQVSGYDLVNNDHPQVIEIWNNVFMEFERKADKSLVKLPAKHVDTGMGFERLVRAIQNKTSNYDTDIFTPTLAIIEALSGLKYGQNEPTDIAMRVIADHIRAIAFTIADGQLPSNVKQGYVIRRILRRAVRYGYSKLNLKEPFLVKLIPNLAEQFADVFPELKAQQEFVSRVILEEETSFLRTLENGLRLFEAIKPTVKNNMIEGKVVFELYDTFGFPLDLTALIARENGMSIDEAGFNVLMQEQKDRSRQATKVEKGDWIVLDEEFEKTEFIGYEYQECNTKIVKYREVKDAKQSYFQIVLEKTPFYAESGGQVGDKGTLSVISHQGTVTLNVFDTKKENDLIVHLVVKNKETADFPSLKDLESLQVKAKIDTNRRSLTENNHSATHLAHAALRQVLGTHVAQKGSLVNDEVLRFDFSHFAKVTDEELAKVETIVNQKIRENIALEERRNVPIEEAKNLGAMALFGEKYGDFVRVITFDKNYSVELCGGTHVPNTGKIGAFKFIAESSVAAGVRRIEAVTSTKAEELVNAKLKVVDDLVELLKNPKDIVKTVSNLLDEKAELQKQIEKFCNKELLIIKKEIIGKVKPINSLNFLAEKVEVSNRDDLRKLSFDLEKEVENLFSVLVANIGGTPHIAVLISKSLLENEELNAIKITKELAKIVNGGGGGQPFFATAAGKDTSKLHLVLENAEKIANNPDYTVSINTSAINEMPIPKKNSPAKNLIFEGKGTDILLIRSRIRELSELCKEVANKNSKVFDVNDIRFMFFYRCIIETYSADFAINSSYDIWDNINKQVIPQSLVHLKDLLLSSDFDFDFEAHYNNNIKFLLFLTFYIELEELITKLYIAYYSKSAEPEVMSNGIVKISTGNQEHYHLFDGLRYSRNTIHNLGSHEKLPKELYLKDLDITFSFREGENLTWLVGTQLFDVLKYLIKVVDEIISSETIKKLPFIEDRFAKSTLIKK